MSENKRKFLLIFMLLSQTVVSVNLKAETVEYVVSGTSMAPTLLPGDKIQVDTHAYINKSPLINDIVSVIFNSRSRPMVKRVVAIAGDNVRLDGKDLWRNQKKLVNVHLFSHGGRSHALSTQLRNYGNIIPTGNAILLGDYSRDSKDSQRFGLVGYAQIQGKVMMVNGKPVPLLNTSNDQ